MIFKRSNLFIFIYIYNYILSILKSSLNFQIFCR
ncbi:hypothetical protein [Campylobacter phage CJLB-14]|nr:hypothetical protein [Campylobacter phage CJLB-14]